MNEPLISFAIPTYNRGAKLDRLLKLLYAQLASVDPGVIEVLVSNNGSIDDTARVMEAYVPAGARLFHQTSNLGFDVNVRFLYEQARGQYVWFFSDDDLLLPGAISTVLGALLTVRPDVLMFSFIQPPHLHPTFNTPSPITVITDVKRAIETVVLYWKLSIYVIRKDTQVEPFPRTVPMNTHFDFVILALSALQRSATPMVCTLRAELASCDDEYTTIRYEPEATGSLWKVADHPFVQQHCRDLKSRLQKHSQKLYIAFLMNFRDGKHQAHPDVAAKYAQAVRELTFLQCFRHDARKLLKRFAMALKLMGPYRVMRRRIMQPRT